MTKVHKSCDINAGEARPVVLSLGEQARRLARGSLHVGIPATTGGPAAASAAISAVQGGAAAIPGGHAAGAGFSGAGSDTGSDAGQFRLAAEQMLSQAADEAGRLIREARQQAIDIEREAYAAGYEAGCRQARLEQAEQGRQMAAQVQSMVGDLERRSRQQLEQLEPEVLELSLQVAEKVIGRELSRNDEAFRSLVRAALARLRQSDRVCVRVNEHDADWLAEDIGAGLPVAESVQVKAESQLPSGTCLIETDAGLVDASVPVQMRRIRERLQEARA